MRLSSKRELFLIRLWSGLLLVVLLAGCNLPARPANRPAASQPADATLAVTGQQAGETPAALIPTNTPAPTAAANKVVLLALPEADPGATLALEPVLTAQAAQAGLAYETRRDLAGTALEPDVRLVVVPPPDPGVMNLANANPNVQFLAVNVPGLQAGKNLSVIAGGGTRADQPAFAAGYLAAVITSDWRVGVISRSDTSEGKAARNGFMNGVVFYCGLCRPAYPPFVQYPFFAEVTAEADAAALQAAADSLVANAVKTVYVGPGVGDAALLEYLAQKGLTIIGGVTPPPAAADHWAASLRADPAQAVKDAFARLLNGEQGFSLETPLAVTDRNPALFSPGRQRLVDDLLGDLLKGFIDTGVNPETGDLKN